jgi:hypothetical protein
MSRVTSPATDYVLWGFHPRYTGPAGVIPIRLAAGNLRECNAAQRTRTAEGSWTLGIYAQSDYPLGLALQCKALYQTPTKTWDGVPLEAAASRQAVSA